MSVVFSSTNRSLFGIGIAAAIAGTFGVVACSDGDVTKPPPVGASTPSPTPSDTTDSGAVDAPSSSKPIYALGILVFGNGAQTTYLQLLDSFDTQPNVTLASAREFAGYAAASASDGKLIVSSGDAPKITRYAIDEDKRWTEEATLGFGNYSQTPLTQSIYVSNTQAYAPFDALGYVAWNPSTFTIGAEVPQPKDIPLERDGLGVYRGYASIVSGTYAYQPFYFMNSTFTQLGKTSIIGVLDAKTSTWIATPNVDCPHMHLTTKDDDGNMYFSPGQYSVPLAVLDANFPRNCMVRIKPGQTTLDPDFGSVKFADLAGGREGSNFFYVGNGIGFFNVFHAERENIGPTTSPNTITYSANYHLWTYDLKTKVAAIMPGIDYSGGQYTSYRIDDRVFVAIPAGNYGSTAVYEITKSGTAEKRFDTQGWTFNMFRIR